MNGSDVLPLIEELSPPPEPEEVFVRLARLPHCLFLDSALRHPTLGRYSFLAADPFDFLQFPADGSDALAALDARMEPFVASAVPELPPFQGGAAGLLGYELGRSWSVCRALPWTSSVCPPWPWACTTSWWRSITCSAGRGSFRRDCPKPSPRAGIDVPPSVLPRCAFGFAIAAR